MENFKVIEERKNPLFGRKEISFQVTSEVAPSRMEIGKVVSEKFSTEPKKIKIKKISGKFGSKNFNVSVFVYDSEDVKKRLEIKRKKDSHHIPREKPKEEKKEEKAADKKEGKKE